MAPGGACGTCRDRKNRDRGTASGRGYDRAWARWRVVYLLANPFCALCPRAATIPDHWPDSRRRLVTMGVADPDAEHRLRPLCAECHRTETARLQPGGWHRDAMRT